MLAQRLRGTGSPRALAAAAALTLAASSTLAQFAGFTGPTFFPGGDPLTDVAVADLNGDGVLDLASTRFTPDTFDDVAVVLGAGDGTYGAASFYGVGASPTGIAAADVDKDGDVDLVVANRDSDDLSVLRNNGDGTFAPEVIIGGVGNGPQDVAAGDVDGDGDTDIVAAIRLDDRVRVVLGDGTGVGWTLGGSFTTNNNDGNFGDQPVAILLDHVSADGDLDIATANAGSGTVTYLEGIGDGTFFSGDFALLLGVGTSPLDVKAGDVDKDGARDIIACNGDPDDTITVHFNGGGAAPTFPSSTTFAVAGGGSRPIGLGVVDIDKDGDLDVLTSNEVTNNVSVHLGNGAGGFSAGGTFAAGNSPNPLGVGDLDNDGDPDVAVPNFASDDWAVLLNNCTIIGGPPPVAEITSPAELDCICDLVTITGEADVPGGVFESFTLEYRRIQPSPVPTWTTIASGNTPVNGGVLAVWDTTGLTEGRYLLRLTVRSAGGLEETAVIAVWVSQNFNALDFFVTNGDEPSPGPAEVVGGVACPYGTVNDNACGPDEYFVDFAPAGSGSFNPVDPMNPVFSGGRFNQTLAEWDTTAVPDGKYDVRVTAVNGCGDSRQDLASVIVDNTAPVAEIQDPVNCDGFQRGGIISIFGTAQDENLAGWTLQYTGGPTNSWVTIASGNTNVVNGLLAEWDTSDLPACCYTLRLVVTDKAVVNCDNRGRSRVFLTSIDVGCQGDLNGDGQVDGADLGLLLQGWGFCP